MATVALTIGLALYFFWDFTLFLLGLFWEFLKAYPFFALLLLGARRPPLNPSP